MSASKAWLFYLKRKLAGNFTAENSVQYLKSQFIISHHLPFIALRADDDLANNKTARPSVFLISGSESGECILKNIICCCDKNRRAPMAK